MADYRELVYQRYRSRLAVPFPAAHEEYALRAAYLRRFARKLVPPDRSARILDLGCGAGRLLQVLSEMGYRNLLGVDISPEQLALASQLPGVVTRQDDISQFLTETPDREFDVVIAFDVLEHFSRDELIPLLRSIHRCLRPHGQLIAHVPNAEGTFGARSLYLDITHQTGWTRVSAAQLVAAAGFTKFRAYEDTPAIHGPVSLVRGVLWRILRAWWRFQLAIETGDLSPEVVLSQNMLFVCER